MGYHPTQYPEEWRRPRTPKPRSGNKRPDDRPAAGICNALNAKQEKSEEGRTTTPWHRRWNFFGGGTECERLGRFIRSPESSRILLCLFPCGRRPRLSALTSIKLKLCALPWGPPLTAYSRLSFLCLRRSSISIINLRDCGLTFVPPYWDSRLDVLRTRLTSGHAPSRSLPLFSSFASIVEIISLPD